MLERQIADVPAEKMRAVSANELIESARAIPPSYSETSDVNNVYLTTTGKAEWGSTRRCAVETKDARRRKSSFPLSAAGLLPLMKIERERSSAYSVYAVVLN